jgi:hypothetical protein
MPAFRTLALAALPLALLAGCDLLGIEPASAVQARREAEGKAVGAGCRHAARSIEQCYEQNKRADKAAVFAGWREMEDYMRENKLEAVPPPPETQAAATARAEPKAEADDEPAAKKPAAKDGEKPARKDG